MSRETRAACRASTRSARPDGAPALATRAARAAIGTDAEHGSVMPPLHLSANYLFSEPGVCGRYDYTRSGNPTRDLLGETIATLEGGTGAVVTASGMAAVTVVLQLLGRGDLLVAPHDCYGGTHRLINALAGRVGFEVLWLDQTLEESLARVAELRPTLVWVETPSNPLLRVTDIRRWAELAERTGATCVVDNTFLSPALQRPLELGADLVVHSTTKFLNGHSDVVGGAVVAKDAELLEDLAWWANCLGVTGSPFDAYQTLRGVRTLVARQRVQESNALEIVSLLAEHPAVRRVWHPSLPDHPGHEVARRQQHGWGSLVSFELHGGLPAVRAFVNGLVCFSLAESLGGVESLVAHPATMTHASMDSEARRVAGIRDGLLRLSVGIEDARDLEVDLAAALVRAEEASWAAV